MWIPPELDADKKGDTRKHTQVHVQVGQSTFSCYLFFTPNITDICHQTHTHTITYIHNESNCINNSNCFIFEPGDFNIVRVQKCVALSESIVHLDTFDVCYSIKFRVISYVFFANFGKSLHLLNWWSKIGNKRNENVFHIFCRFFALYSLLFYLLFSYFISKHLNIASR